MRDFDPAELLPDLVVRGGKAVLARLEEAALPGCCPCYGIGFAKEWLYKREPKCTCSAATDDFVYTLHDPDCDTVPCPFCPLENDRELT